MYQASVCRLPSLTFTAGPAVTGVRALARAKETGAEARADTAAAIPGPATGRTGGPGKRQPPCSTRNGDVTSRTEGGGRDRHPGRPRPGHPGPAAHSFADRGRP